MSGAARGRPDIAFMLIEFIDFVRILLSTYFVKVSAGLSVPSTFRSSIALAPYLFFNPEVAAVQVSDATHTSAAGNANCGSCIAVDSNLVFES